MEGKSKLDIKKLLMFIENLLSSVFRYVNEIEHIILVYGSKDDFMSEI